MRFVLIPVASYLILYGPGHFLLRPAGGSESPVGSRLFREVLLSTVCASWVGFILAETGQYSIFTLLGGLTVVTLLGRLLREPARTTYHAREIMGLAICLITCAWVAAPLDTRLLGADSSGYLAGGEHLAQRGTLTLHDPTMQLLSPDLKRTLFPSVASDRGSPPYLRLMGSMILRNLDSGEVLPAFHHLITIWVAAFSALGGPAAAEWSITLFAGLAVWAVVEFAVDFVGMAAGLACGVLLLCLAPQYWYSRFLMPEVPAQFFLWGGLCCLAWWRRSNRQADALLAGLAFGVAGVMRIENVAFIVAALVISTLLSPRSERRAGMLALAAATPLWLHGAMHLLVFRTHYLGNLRTLVAQNVPTPSSAAITAAVCGSIAFAALRTWRRFPTAEPRRAVPVLVGLATATALWGDLHHGWPSITLLRSYLGTLIGLGGGIGLLIADRRHDNGAIAYRVLVVLAAVVLVQVLLQPHATPVPIWAIRRSVTVLLPALCLGFVVVCEAVHRRWHWLAAFVLLAGALISEVPLLRAMRSEPYYVGATRHVQALAALLPHGARVLYDGSLLPSQLPPALWVQRDAPGFFLAANDTARIRELAEALGDAPLYWINDGSTPPPQGDGLVAIQIAHYEFLLPTPGLDRDSAPGTISTWDYSVGIYSLRFDKPETTTARRSS